MTENPLLFLSLALILGLKHSYDADHLVAVSNLLTRSKSTRSTARLSTVWAVGHMLTASIITVTLFRFKETVLSGLSNLEVLVVIMLMVIGFFGFFSETRYYHEHFHRHLWSEHSHPHYHVEFLSRLRRAFRKLRETSGSRQEPEQHREAHKVMLGIGIIHGLASNDELLILFTISLGVTSLLGLLLGVGIFSIGVVAGMILYGVGITYPILRFGRTRVRRMINLGVASLSIVYAVLLLMGFEIWNPLTGLVSES